MAVPGRPGPEFEGRSPGLGKINDGCAVNGGVAYCIITCLIRQPYFISAQHDKIDISIHFYSCQVDPSYSICTGIDWMRGGRHRYWYRGQPVVVV